MLQNMVMIVALMLLNSLLTSAMLVGAIEYLREKEKEENNEKRH